MSHTLASLPLPLFVSRRSLPSHQRQVNSNIGNKTQKQKDRLSQLRGLRLPPTVESAMLQDSPRINHTHHDRSRKGCDRNGSALWSKPCVVHRNFASENLYNPRLFQISSRREDNQDRKCEISGSIIPAQESSRVGPGVRVRQGPSSRGSLLDVFLFFVDFLFFDRRNASAFFRWCLPLIVGIVFVMCKFTLARFARGTTFAVLRWRLTLLVGIVVLSIIFTRILLAGRVALAFLRLAVGIAVFDCVGHVARCAAAFAFNGRNLLSRQEPSTRTTWPTHSMVVPRFMEIWLATFARETQRLLQLLSSHSAFENAMKLLGVDVQRRLLSSTGSGSDFR